MCSETEREPTDYSISRHAAERYAERIAEKEKISDIANYATSHEDDIRVWINKLITYGSVIYEGDMREHKNNRVVINDRWVIIIDTETNNVITLYKLDLGDDEVTSLYISRCLDRIDRAKRELDETTERCRTLNSELSETISYNENEIGKLQNDIEYLKDSNEYMKESMKMNNKEISRRSRKVEELVDFLIGWHKF